jgi:hypothetical protein
MSKPIYSAEQKQMTLALCQQAINAMEAQGFMLNALIFLNEKGDVSFTAVPRQNGMAGNEIAQIVAKDTIRKIALAIEINLPGEKTYAVVDTKPNQN